MCLAASVLVKMKEDINLATVDGIWGTKTNKAVLAFQKDKGLDADGIVGAKTWDALLK